MPPALAFDTAISFTTNTSWQSYAGESTLGHLALAAGLDVQDFLSVAMGIAAAVALIRGLIRGGTDLVGNFWVDIIRAAIRLVLPLAAAGALLLRACVQDAHLSLRCRGAGRDEAVRVSPVVTWVARPRPTRSETVRDGVMNS